MADATEDLGEQGYISSPDDGLPARVVNAWSKDKHYYLARYIDIFERGMSKSFRHRVYIDLFSGPGICCIKGKGEYIDGSPLLALKAKPPFSEYHFADLDSIATDALRARCKAHEKVARIHLYPEDCKTAARKIVSKVGDDALSLAFLDPTGLHFTFETVRTLAQKQRMDMIIHFPHGTAIKRNLDKWTGQEGSLMDDFFGGSEWRPIAEKHPASLDRLTSELLNLYRSKLRGLGYDMEPDQAVLIANSKNVPMYSLIFASRHPRGIEFWREIKKISSSGQRDLF